MKQSSQTLRNQTLRIILYIQPCYNHVNLCVQCVCRINEHKHSHRLPDIWPPWIRVSATLDRSSHAFVWLRCRGNAGIFPWFLLDFLKFVSFVFVLSKRFTICLSWNDYVFFCHTIIIWWLCLFVLSFVLFVCFQFIYLYSPFPFQSWSWLFYVVASWLFHVVSTLWIRVFTV